MRRAAEWVRVAVILYYFGGIFTRLNKNPALPAELTRSGLAVYR
jgi:hypothetical protein